MSGGREMSAHPTMDPELAAAITTVPAIDVEDLATARATNDVVAETLLANLSYEDVDVVDVVAPGLDGAPDVPIRLLRPSGVTGDLPVLLAMHGGGFVLGRAQDYEYFCLEAVRQLGIAVANVEYRLAPETPFPGPLDDCYAALLHVHAHAAQLGIDPTRIAVGGSSAGGGLAAGTVLRARDEGRVPIVFQCLLSPALDDRLATPSVARFGQGRTGTLIWQYYLGDGYTGPDDADVSPYAAPARADDLTGLPPTYIAQMELDAVRDEGFEYALRLLGAGVSVELHSHPGTFHGSVEFVPSAASSLRITSGILDALRRGLSLQPTPP